MNFYKKSEKKAPAIGIQFNHGDVQLKPNYFKKQRSSSSFLLTWSRYSCNKITTTQIQISRQNLSDFFSNISHQMMI